MTAVSACRTITPRLRPLTVRQVRLSAKTGDSSTAMSAVRLLLGSIAATGVTMSLVLLWASSVIDLVDLVAISASLGAAAAVALIAGSHLGHNRSAQGPATMPGLTLTDGEMRVRRTPVQRGATLPLSHHC